jgi:hypothetical protein
MKRHAGSVNSMLATSKKEPPMQSATRATAGAKEQAA